MLYRLATLVLLAQTACASITGSASDTLRVYSNPPSAEVVINGENRGSAPVSIDVPKHGHNLVEVQAEGYETANCSTSMSASGGYIAADVALCVLLFPIGCISFIDAGGAWNQLDSNQCHVKLHPLAKP